MKILVNAFGISSAGGITVLKKTIYDVGGLDATTPQGIAHFKKGVQPDPYYLIGEWRDLMYPWKNINNKI